MTATWGVHRSLKVAFPPCPKHSSWVILQSPSLRALVYFKGVSQGSECGLR